MVNNGGIYAFWDLIAQEAYLPKMRILKDGTFKRFSDRETGKRVWIFGCSGACRALIEQYKDSWNIAGVLDNSAAMQGKEYCGVKVYAPGEVVTQMREDKDVIVLSLRLNADIAAEQMVELGFSNLYSLGVLLSEMEPYYSFIEDIQKLKCDEPLEDTVLMESMSDFDGNVGALYEYLKGSRRNHRFVWICKSEDADSPFLDEKDRKLYPHRSIDDLKEFVKVRATARWEIWECDPIRKVRNDQINVFLQHYGMGYKQVAHLYNSPDYVDYVLTTNALVHEFEKKSITYAEGSTFLYGELPRNDVLSGKSWNELDKITMNKYQKVILWAPTLRESRYYQRIDSDISYPYGVSLLYDDEDMRQIDAYLKGLDILLIIKPHPRQKLNYMDKDYDNILYLTGERLKNVHSYKLLTQIDALITDYSSIVFDYMLLDRPCAWVLEDREHYKIDYLMDDPDEYMPGEKIYQMDDLLRFFKNVSEGKDLYEEERRKICARCNPPAEGKGCENLAEALGL